MQLTNSKATTTIYKYKKLYCNYFNGILFFNIILVYLALNVHALLNLLMPRADVHGISFV